VNVGIDVGVGRIIQKRAFIIDKQAHKKCDLFLFLGNLPLNARDRFRYVLRLSSSGTGFLCRDGSYVAWICRMSSRWLRLLMYGDQSDGIVSSGLIGSASRPGSPLAKSSAGPLQWLFLVPALE
jgi:hypothetical protein